METHDLKDHKLLVITNSYPDRDLGISGGMFVKEQVDELSKYFEEIYVISPQPFGVNRALFDYNYENVRVFFPRFFHLPIGYFRKRLGDNFFKAAMRVIKREKLEFDLIHAHFTWPSGYAGVMLGKKFGVQVIITVHEDHNWLVKEVSSCFRKLEFTWKNADALIRVNKKDVMLLKKFNNNVYSIPNGFNPKRLPIIKKNIARGKLGLKSDVKIVFSLGNLVEQKGHKYLIQAMTTVVRNYNDVVCYIGGKGPLKNELQRQINKLGLQNYVKLLGFVPDDQLALWMNAADLFVLPSLSESFGLVVLEAMAVGTPVVATVNGGSEEIITSEDYGLLCPPKDPECLAEKILIALDKEWDREKIRKYAEQFKWENIVGEILGVYQSIMGGHDET